VGLSCAITKQNEEQASLFLGMEAHAPWPAMLPDAHMVQAQYRHLTLIFLGKTSYQHLCTLLPHLPLPPFRIGPVSIFDSCLFLPKHHPRVVAWHVKPFGENDLLTLYQKQIFLFFKKQGYRLDVREPIHHVTLGRLPFVIQEWKEAFQPLPLYLQNVHLYASRGGLCYEPIWTHPILPPFEEVEHVADVAFHIFGENLQQLYYHAQIALTFAYPQILPFLRSYLRVKNLEEIIIELNQIIAKVDQELGISCKAVSFHGDVKRENEVFVWEMVVDV